MRNITFLVVILALASCSNHEVVSVSDNDSANLVMKKLKATDTLDALFLIRDEKQMKQVFGAKNVITDTLEGVEGELYPGTTLFGDTPDEVFIRWGDTLKKANIISLRLACQYDENEDAYNCNSRWKTRTGVQLGTTLNKLVELNGRDFSFFGLGWDYGGGVSNWKNGVLSSENIFVTLGVDNMTDEQRKQYLKVLGDHKYSSNDPAARGLDPIVLEIILSAN